MHRRAARKQFSRNNFKRKPKTSPKANPFERVQKEIKFDPDKVLSPFNPNVSPSSNSKYIIGTLFGLMLIGKCIAETHHQIEKNAGKKGIEGIEHEKTGSEKEAREEGSIKNKVLEKRVERLCVNGGLFEQPNKPRDVRLGRNTDGVTMPESCVDYLKTNDQNHLQACTADQQKFTDHRNTYDPVPYKLQESRNGITQNIKLYSELDKLKTNTPLDEKQSQYFHQTLTTLRQVEEAKIVSEYATAIKLGNCAESSNYNLYHLLKADVNHELKIQMVEIEKNAEINHQYLLINSNAKDVDIKNNQRSVENYMRKITEGYYCDTWNGKIYKKIPEYDNKYYQKGWAGIKITTISLDFNPDILPEEYNKFINRTLRRLGFKEMKKVKNNREEMNNPKKLIV